MYRDHYHFDPPRNSVVSPTAELVSSSPIFPIPIPNPAETAAIVCYLGVFFGGDIVGRTAKMSVAIIAIVLRSRHG